MKSLFNKLLPFLSLTLLCFVLYLPGIKAIPMDDRDSAHFTQATKQMLETNNYFQIRYQDITRFQKPPGINWLQAACVKIFSPSDITKAWPYRLASVIGAWLSVLFTFVFGRRLFSTKIAWIGAAILACTVLMSVEAHLAVIDTNLLFSIILMQGALGEVYQKVRKGEKVSFWWGVLFFASMAYGGVLKGVTLLVGPLTLIALSLIDKTLAYIRALHCLMGVLILAVLSGLWLYGVSVAEHTNYLMQMFHHDLGPKLAGGHESHGAPFGTHTIALLVTFWPFSLFLIPTAIITYKNRKNSILRFLLCWIIPIWFCFECMPTKLPQYVLPIFPPLALLTAFSLFSPLIKKVYEWRSIRVLIIGWGLLSLGLALAPAGILYALGIQDIATWVIVSVMIAVFLALIAIVYSTKNIKKTVTCLIAASFLIFPVAYHGFLPNLTPVWTSEHIAKALPHFDTLSPKEPLYVVGYGEPSLVFLFGTHRIKFDSVEGILSSMHAPCYIAIDNEFYPELYDKLPKNLILQPIKTLRTFNYNKGKWITILVFKLDLNSTNRHIR